ncbi:MAG: hypothetical protein SynsKO_43450 [Synoicihabitans sp.]
MSPILIFGRFFCPPPEAATAVLFANGRKTKPVSKVDAEMAGSAILQFATYPVYEYCSSQSLNE